MMERDVNLLIPFQQGEMDAVYIYEQLAKVVKNPKDQRLFRQLAIEENHHGNILKDLTKVELRPKKLKGIIVPLLYKVFGARKIYPKIAQGEYDSIEGYQRVVRLFPEVEKIIRDEKRHGDSVLALLD